jgi:glycosyltransferase involved in cell wall biosynthesis
MNFKHLSGILGHEQRGSEPGGQALERGPLVSCVIIFLDAAPYLDEAVASVYEQDFGRWELLLVDDGSTDGSTEIARRHAGEHPERVRYLEHPGHANLGMSASRNLGVCRSGGEYIALLDADDVWLPHKLSTQVAALEAHPEAAMAYDSTLYWFPGDPRAERMERARRLGFPAGSLIRAPGLIPLFLTGEAETPGTCSVLIRRRVFDDVGGFVNAFRGLYEDQAFFYKVCLDFPVLLCDGHSALYRQHAESCCNAAEAEGVYRADGSGAAIEPFLDWLSGHVCGRFAVPDSPAGALEPDLREYFLRRHRRPRSWTGWAKAALKNARLRPAPWRGRGGTAASGPATDSAENVTETGDRS